MEPFIIYLLKANVVITILFLFYLLVLKNDKSFRQNRIYLLFSLLLSLFLPFLPALTFSRLQPIQHTIIIANPLNSLYTTIGDSQTVNTHFDNARVAVYQGFSPSSLPQTIIGIYLMVSLVLLVRLLIKVLKISILIKKSNKQFTGGVSYCDSDEMAPFSFFNNLVINKTLYNDRQLQQIILHEKVHIRQWHSIDILFAELVHALLWINPLMTYFKQCVKLNNEYIADAEVVDSGVDKKFYQLSILHCSLKIPQAYSLTNLYSSSNIELRIKMMNLKKSPKLNAYKYLFALLLVASSYSLINPSVASPLRQKFSEKSTKVAPVALEALEGLYKMPDNDGFIKVTNVNDGLMVKQLWNGYEFSLKQQSKLEFTTPDGRPFKFTTDKTGKARQLLAFNRDTWIKVNNVNLKNAALNPQQLKALEGIYQSETSKAVYIQVIAEQNTLVAKQLWDGKEIIMSAQSDVSFFVQDPRFNLIAFTKNDRGIATEFRTINKENWNKVDRYQPPVEIKLTAQDLKKFDGFYEFKDRKGQFLQISATSNGLILKQLWDNREIDFAAISPLAFFAKENPQFTLQFTADNAGRITQVLAFGKDVWVRNDNYHAPVEIKLAAQDLKKMEGKYEFRNEKGQFLQISVTGNGLVLKQLWDGQQIDFAATSPLEFFSKKQPGFTLKFTSDNAGHITQVLAFGQDIWDKVN